MIEPSKRERTRLLLADGDHAMRAWLKSTLDHCDVAEVTNGFELLDRLAEEGPYDLVITEVRMPEGKRPQPTGVQVAAMARDAGLRTPFLVITEKPDARLPELLKAVGEALLLPKPFGRGALLIAIRTLLSPKPEVQTAQ